MFDIAWTELLLVAMIAIIVVGPKELPGMLRAFGKTLGQFRRMSREFQSTFNDALRDAERQAGMDEIKQNISDIKDPIKSTGIADSLNETTRSISDAMAEPKPAQPAANPDVVPLNGAEKPGAASSGQGANANNATPSSATPNNVTPSSAEPKSPEATEPPANDAPNEAERRAAAGGER